jgi:hypothetical protein
MRSGGLKLAASSRIIPSTCPCLRCGFGKRENCRYSLTMSFRRSSSFRTDRISPPAVSLPATSSRGARYCEKSNSEGFEFHAIATQIFRPLPAWIEEDASPASADRHSPEMRGELSLVTGSGYLNREIHQLPLSSPATSEGSVSTRPSRTACLPISQYASRVPHRISVSAIP